MILQMASVASALLPIARYDPAELTLATWGAPLYLGLGSAGLYLACWLAGCQTCLYQVQGSEGQLETLTQLCFSLQQALQWVVTGGCGLALQN